MLAFQKLLLGMVPLIGTARAATECNNYNTYTAKFEALPTGAVPSGFSGVDWTNFEVAPGHAARIKPASGSKIALADPYDSIITQAGGSPFTYTEDFQIRSLFFSCYANPFNDAPNDPYNPYQKNNTMAVPCSLQIIAQTPEFSQAIQNVGTYDYDGGEVMMNVTLPHSNANMYRFILVDGQGDALLAFDNIVMVNYNPSCPL